MTRFVTALFCAAALAAPSVAQSDNPATPGAAKTKRVCRMRDNGNPMHPARVCREVAIKSTEAAAATSPAAAPAEAVQVAQNSTTPHR